MDPDVKKQLVAKLKELATEECFLCCDAPQPPFITRCCHGPACRDCWTRSLESSVTCLLHIRTCQVSFKFLAQHRHHLVHACQSRKQVTALRVLTASPVSMHCSASVMDIFLQSAMSGSCVDAMGSEYAVRKRDIPEAVCFVAGCLPNVQRHNQ